MAKRRNENGQMRREEYEAREGGDDVTADSFSIGFARADEAALRKRKIVKARVGGAGRPPVAAKPKPAAAPASAAQSNGSGAEKANPFGGFQGLTAAKPASSNPFAGFAGLTGGSTASTTSTGASSKPNVAVASTGSSVSTAGSYQEAMEGLNKEFLAFVTSQVQENPGSSWIAAVQDYLKYATEIGAKHAATKPVTISEQTKRSSPAPFSFSAAPAASAPSSSSTSASNTGFSFGGAAESKKTKEDKPAKDKSPVSKSSTPGFSFGGGASLFSKKASDSEEKVTPAFSFGSLPKPTTAAPAAPAASGGFSFGNLSAPKPSSDSTAPVSSGLKPFSFGASSTTAASSSTPASASAAPQDEDEETVGREEATVILKADTPDEECMFEAEKAKILEFKKDEKRWADKGVHPLKVLVNKESKSARILVRNEIGKIVLNAALYKGLKVTVQEAKGKKTGVTLALQAEGGTMAQFLLKVKATRVDEFAQALESAVASA